jgi:hypothetical protein
MHNQVSGLGWQGDKLVRGVKANGTPWHSHLNECFDNGFANGFLVARDPFDSQEVHEPIERTLRIDVESDFGHVFLSFVKKWGLAP